MCRKLRLTSERKKWYCIDALENGAVAPFLKNRFYSICCYSLKIWNFLLNLI